MIIFFSFLIADLVIVGCFAAVYGSNAGCEKGLLLGVHIPSYEAENSEVKEVLAGWRRWTKRFYLWNLLISTALAFLCFLYISIFMVAWSVWLLVFCIFGIGKLCIFHRKMYDVKVKNGWYAMKDPFMAAVDTNVSAMAGKLPLSPWWHLPAILFSVVIWILTAVQGTVWEFKGYGLLLALLTIMFLGLHIWYSYRANIVYSEVSSVNLAVNRLEKRTWSLLWIGADYLNLFSLLLMLYAIVSHGWLDRMDIFIFIFIQSVIGGLVVLTMWVLRKKKAEILAEDTQPYFLDDDMYWKNGWYDNPKDSKLWVQDRMCNMNYSMNMAKPVAKIINIGTIIGVVALLIWVCGMFLAMDFKETQVQIEQEEIQIYSGMYDSVFSRSDILSLDLLEALPDEHFARTNGANTETLLQGNFTGQETGKCRLYIYRGYAPILKIVLPEYTVFMNSREEGAVEKWYNELQRGGK